MSADIAYEVQIEEHVVETRVFRIPRSQAASPQAAANAAYEAWILRGSSAEEITFDVQDRTYEVDGEFFDVEADV